MTDNIPLGNQGTPDQKDLVISAKAGKTYHFAFYALWIIEILLTFRIILKLFGANPSNIFAEVIYGATYLLVLPFRTIFAPVASTTPGVQRVFETSTLFAMFVYVVVIWSVAKFILIKESKPQR